jgi:hypothetical protein
MPRRSRTEPLYTPPAVLAFPSFDVAGAHELVVEAWQSGALEGTRQIGAGSRVADVAARLAAFGFEGSVVGGVRAVFFHPCGWLFKCPLQQAGVLATEEELARLAHLRQQPTWMRRHFPITRDLGDSVLLQRRYRVTPSEAGDRWAEIQHLSWSLRIPDLQPSNVGFDIDGTVVFVDFSAAALSAR